MRVSDCKLIELKRIVDARGSLSVAEASRDLPFELKRVFFIYDVPTAQGRGAHAHKTLHQFLICLSGGFDVELDDATSSKTVRLNRPWLGLHVPPMIWASETNFDPGSVCLVLCSDYFKADDYYRDYTEYLAAVRSLARSA